ncbi:MAG: hypothetical protein CMB46_00835 [Euryarchaeota archaeon]|nr:hypothetical protein [Euryarchaeota archaeon]
MIMKLTGEMHMFDVGLIGGTFDRFHKGHLHLLSKSLEKCSELEVWINSDNLAKKKDPRVQTWEVRHHNIKSSLDEESLSRVSFGELEDNFGPAPTHEKAQVIFSTEDTMQNCIEINKLRIMNELDPLEIVILELQNAWDGIPISSSRIRDGVIDREGNSWIPESIRSGTIALTPEVEGKLKDPFGTLFSGPEDNPLVAMRDALSHVENQPGPMIAVGDVTVLTMHQLGATPDISIIDGLTKREEWGESSNIDQSLYGQSLNCSSPPGSLTASLLGACEEAVNSWMKDRSSTIINVEGEEDLAPLLMHPLSPIGAVVLYGQPGKGVVVRICGEESKGRCRQLLESFISVD